MGHYGLDEWVIQPSALRQPPGHDFIRDYSWTSRKVSLTVSIRAKELYIKIMLCIYPQASHQSALPSHINNLSELNSMFQEWFFLCLWIFRNHTLICISLLLIKRIPFPRAEVSSAEHYTGAKKRPESSFSTTSYST